MKNTKKTKCYREKKIGNYIWNGFLFSELWPIVDLNFIETSTKEQEDLLIFLFPPDAKRKTSKSKQNKKTHKQK